MREKVKGDKRKMAYNILLGLGIIIGFGLLIAYLSGFNLATFLASMYIMSIFAVYMTLIPEAIIYAFFITNGIYLFYGLGKGREG